MMQWILYGKESQLTSSSDNFDWYGQGVETDNVSLKEDSTGKAIIMRVFEFTLPPFDNDNDLPTEAELVEAHKSKITAFLWRDELVPVMDYKAVISTDKKTFKIFATAQAKAGSNILEKPEKLNG
jgi:hypothetical protein